MRGSWHCLMQVQVPVAIYVLKGGTCRTRYCRGVRGGESGSTRISAGQDMAGTFKHGHGLGSALAVLRLYALGERRRGGNLKLGRAASWLRKGLVGRDVVACGRRLGDITDRTVCLLAFGE